MRHLKARLLGIVLILVCAGLIYVNWQQLANESTYSMKLASFGPVGVMGGVFLLLFPGMGGKPETARDFASARFYNQSNAHTLR